MTEEVIRLTDRAAGKIREFLETGGIEGRTVRITLVRTHCMMGRGHAYDLRPESSRKDGDEAVEVGGVTVLVDAASADRLRGTEIDYRESLEASGFAITNPNAAGKCPCGHHDLFE